MLSMLWAGIVSEEDLPYIQPLPQLLDVSDHQQGRSTLGGFFKPKYRDYPRDNVHRSSEKHYKEVIDGGTGRSKTGGHSLHSNAEPPSSSAPYIVEVNDGKLPRTPYPAPAPRQQRQQRRRSSSRSSNRDSSPEMSHNRYLPKAKRSRSPRLSRSQIETAFDGEHTIYLPSAPMAPRASTTPSGFENKPLVVV